MWRRRGIRDRLSVLRGTDRVDHTPSATPMRGERTRGHPPTGKTVTLTGITIFRLAGGRIVERWAEHGTEVMRQLGFEGPV